VRTRLYLGSKLPGEDDSNDDMPTEDGVRFLSRRKANYSAQDWRRIRYIEGVFKPDDPAEPGRARPGSQFMDDAALRAVGKLSEMGHFPTASTSSPFYLPKLAKQYDLLDGASPRDLGEAMRRLQKTGQLKTAEVGRYGNRTPRMGLVVAAGSPK
jgi:hypothetical protein